MTLAGAPEAGIPTYGAAAPFGLAGEGARKAAGISRGASGVLVPVDEYPPVRVVWRSRAFASGPA
ncbi:MAG: hypothetical protein ACREP6_11800, partial [Candidatus Binataceae bacterium]